jgi:hypothetical protein
VAVVLSTVGLRLSEDKTMTVHVDEGFEFLGLRIQQTTRGSNKAFVHTWRRSPRHGAEHDRGYVAERHELVESRIRWKSHVRFGDGPGNPTARNGNTAPRSDPTWATPPWTRAAVESSKRPSATGPQG